MNGFLASLTPATLVMLLAACAPGTSPGEPAAAEPAPPAPAPPAPTPPTDDECGAGRLGAFLGLAAGEDVLARIRAAIGHDRIRVIHPGDAVTMDYRADRLNVELGADSRIERLRCG